MKFHVAVARPRTCSKRTWLARMGALEHRAEQPWDFHQVGMNSVAGDALENQRRNLLSEPNSKIQRHRWPNQVRLQEYQQGVQRHLPEVQNEVRSQHVASGEELETFTQDLSQSLAEGSLDQTLFTTSRSGAYESSAEIQQLRHEREHFDFSLSQFGN